MKLLKRRDMWTIDEVDKGNVLVKTYVLSQEVRIEFTCNKHEVRMSRDESIEMVKQIEESLCRLKRFD